MVLKVMGWENPNVNTDEEYKIKCNLVSLEAKSKKPAHLQNKEFYDKAVERLTIPLVVGGEGVKPPIT